MMFLRNHGTLTHGRSIAEAFALMHNLERACAIQIAAQSGGAELATPANEVIEPRSRRPRASATATSATSASRPSCASSTAKIRLIDSSETMAH